MLAILLIMLAGIAIGFPISRYPRAIQLNNKLISGAIYILLFLLGISVGHNKTILQHLDKIGVQSLIISIGAIAGSVVTLWLVYKFAFKTVAEEGAKNEK